eukprot:4297052-Amphidinium_carterae.1
MSQRLSRRSAVWTMRRHTRIWKRNRSQCWPPQRSKQLVRERCSAGQLLRLLAGSKGNKHSATWQVCSVNGTCWGSMQRQLTMWAKAACTPHIAMVQEHHRGLQRFPDDMAWSWRRGLRWQPVAGVQNGGVGLCFKSHVAVAGICWASSDGRMVATKVHGFGAQE